MNRQIVIVQKVFLVLLAFILVLPLSCGIFQINTNSSLEENRAMAEAPTLSLETLEDFPSSFDQYYNDNFPLRSQFVNMFNNFEYYLMNDGYNSTLQVGKRKWIYYFDYDNPAASTVNDYKRVDPLTEDELLQIKQYLEYLKEKTEENGGKFYFLIAPNKNEIYPEYMPDRIKVTDNPSTLDQLEAYLKEHSDITVISTKQALLDRKEEDELYYSNGTHWNYIGSFYAYQEIAKAISADFPSYVPLTGSDLTRSTDVSFRQYTSDWGDISHSQETTFTINPKQNYVLETEPIPDGYQEGAGGGFQRSVSSKEAGNVKTLKAMVFRDSFGTWLQPYLSQSLNEVAYYWKKAAQEKDILFEKPDIFIYETVQRYIPNLLEASQRVMSSLPTEIKIDAPVIKEPLFHEALDLAGYSEDGRSFDVVGWSYIEEKDTRNQEKFIRLTLANGENLVYKVNAYFSTLGEYFQNSKYDYGRFRISIPASDLSSEVQTVEFMIKENGQYFCGESHPIS